MQLNLILSKKITLLFFVISLISCNNNQTQQKSKNNLTITPKDSASILKKEIIIDSLEQILIDAGLIDIQTLNSNILVDLKYSTTNNFLHEDVYNNLTKAYLQPSVAKDLIKCQIQLKKIDSTLTLLVYDGVRPRSVQQKMWDILKIPINEKTKFVSNPKNGSIHNYGAAVDLTIAFNNGAPLDMGAEFDDIRKIAYPRLEKQFLNSGELSSTQVNNRKLLRKVMKAGGFYNIQTEWWHFNRYNRNKTKTLFQIIE